MKRWSPRLAVSRSRRNIDAACRSLAKVALEWGDVDQSYVDRADELIRELEAFGDQIRDEVEERLSCGEHIGL